MKESFLGYYQPTEDEFNKLWSEGLVVLDTNVLLHLYRVPAGSSEEILEVFSLLKGRLWIPHHVGLEFHRNRLSVIAKAHRDAQSLFDDLGKKFADYNRKIDELQLAKRGVGDIDSLIEDMKATSEKIEERSKIAVAAQLKPNGPDLILNALDDLLKNSVGPAPSTQEEVDRICRDAALRFAVKMGPGYMDVDKDNGGDPKFMAGHLVFEKRYGDYLLWTQMIGHVSRAKTKNVIFVTSDEKEDWWKKVSGGFQAGPLPELREEMRSLGGVDNFWMYTLKDFLKKSVARLQSKVSSVAVSDVESVDVQERLLKSKLSRKTAKPQKKLTKPVLISAARLLGYVLGWRTEGCRIGLSSSKNKHAAIFIRVERALRTPEALPQLIVDAVATIDESIPIIEIIFAADDPPSGEVEMYLVDILPSKFYNDESDVRLYFVGVRFVWSTLGNPIISDHELTPG
ncbi:PIN-like domain-containing protein [Xanthomonas sp. NCPPB 2586]|nr:PIN-like domain-containing protein [Xanthomonas campestris]